MFTLSAACAHDLYSSALVWNNDIITRLLVIHGYLWLWMVTERYHCYGWLISVINGYGALPLVMDGYQVLSMGMDGY